MRYYKVLDKASKFYKRTGKDVGSINNCTWLEFADGKSEWVYDKYLLESNERAFNELTLVVENVPEDISKYEYVKFGDIVLQRVED